MASRKNSLRSTLRMTRWETPDAPVVNTSAVCTLALTAAGGRPRPRRIEEESRPKAMPSAPSISCAPRPTSTNQRNCSPNSMRSVHPGLGKARAYGLPGQESVIRSDVAEVLDEAQGAVAEADGTVEGMGVLALRAAGQLQPGGAAGAGPALGLEHELPAQALPARGGGDHQRGDPAGGGAQREGVHEVQR